jgi:hypothetical protein
MTLLQKGTFKNGGDHLYYTRLKAEPRFDKQAKTLDYLVDIFHSSEPDMPKLYKTVTSCPSVTMEPLHHIAKSENAA